MGELVAVSQRVSEITDYGETRDCLDQAWTTWLERAGYTPVPVPNRLESVEEYLDGLGVAGLVLTGGNDLSFATYVPPQDNDDVSAERDDTERRMVAHCGRSWLPIVAFCRGLQVLHALDGGTLRSLEPTAVNHVAASHEIQLLLEPWRRAAGQPSLLVNSFHDFGFLVDDVAEGWIAAARAEDGVVEGMAHEELPFVAVGWHPERDNRHASDFDVALLRQTLEGSGAGVDRVGSVRAS